MIDALREMYYELTENRLQVILIPQRDPPNRGACLRAVMTENCEWYQDLCADFPSRRKRQYRKFKTAVKRRDIERIMEKMLAGRPVRSKYADWIRRRAEGLEEYYGNLRDRL